MERHMWWIPWLVLAVGCSGPVPGQPEPSMQPVAVEVQTVQRRTLEEVLEASGSVQPASSADVVAKIPGRVVRVTVEEGSWVKRGEVVVQLDPSDLEAQAAQAEASLELARSRVAQAQAAVQLASDTARHQVSQARAAVEAARAQAAAARAQVQAAASQRARAEADLQRVEQLFAQGAIPAQQVDAVRAAAEAARAQHEAARAQERAAQDQLHAAEAALRLAQTASQQVRIRQREAEQAKAAARQAEAALRLVRLQLEQTQVRAPIDGVVVERRIDPGEYAAPGVPLLTVADVSTVRVHLAVSETRIRMVRVGQIVQITVDALPGRTFTGRVEGWTPTADPRTRSFMVKVRVPNADGLLRPGMFARGRVMLQSRPNVPAVPTDALVYEGGRAFVFVVESGRARRRPVTVGLVSGGWAEVRGLAPGTPVVVAGQGLLRDGDPVTVVR